MPRGRHRHSLPLHRLLPPLAVAGVSTACAAAAWLVGEPLLVRSLATIAAVAAIVGAVLLRRWDSAADKRLADLNRARLRDEWRTEERLAELEADAERARGARTKLDAKLRAELALLRNEHAALLRRYATAETERARTLEERRRLALGAPSSSGAAPEGDAVETPGAAAAVAVVAAARGARADAARPAAGREPAATTAAVPTMRLTGLLQPAVYERAAVALRDLARNAAAQRAADAVESAAAPADVPASVDAVAEADADLAAPADAAYTADAADVRDVAEAGDVREAAEAGDIGAAGRDAVRDGRATGSTEAAEHGRADGAAGLAGPVAAPLAAAVVPQPAQAAPQWRPASRAVGGFDFFGNASGAPAARRAGALEDDLADVVGAEAIADHAAHARDAHDAPHEQDATTATAANAADTTDDGVIDLTAHDETEQIDLAELRGAIS